LEPKILTVIDRLAWFPSYPWLSPSLGEQL
jgi:hypothetical protein